MNISKLYKVSIFLLYAWVASLAGLQAQSAEAAKLPEIEVIEIEFEGFRSVSDGYVMGYVQLREGMTYSSVLADQTIRALYATNRFELVTIKVEEAENEAVKVILKLVPKYTLQAIRFEGSDRYSYDRLLDKAELTTGGGAG